ncbi:MAG: DUF4129 domain-containing protein, partial [Planctomycetaceae bacterium]|nr:DUF4129 domain-containing protein [Planctomycetaceae bacterium]
NGTRSSSAPDVRPAERLPSGTKTSPDGRSGSESVKSQTRRESADPGIDIRQELERRGLRGTFEKLVEQARKEANAQKQAEQEARRAMSNNPNSQDQNSGNTSASAGGSATTSDNIRNNDSVERSLLRTLDGLRDDVVEIAKELQEESRQQNPRSSADTGQPGSRQSPHWRPDIKNRSPEISQQRNSGGGPQNGPAKSETLRSIRDGASEFLSDLASGPDAKMPSAPDSASSLESLADAGSSFISIIVPILVIGALLAALLALAAKQTGMWPDAQTETIRASAIRSGTIRTRRDVVTAFHQLTGRTINPSLPSIEDWRTHREAAEQLTMMSPSLNNAVQVLADIYEQARYLPDDYNLTDDQIRDVRDALALCERGANR